jgi:diguanylate cyclase
MIGEPLAMAEEGALLYARIGVLLSEHRLEPSPDNYALCHRYVTAGDSDFNERVERAIAEHGGLTSVAVAALVAQRNAEHSASDLARIADSAQSYLEKIARILGQSGDDAHAYGAALESSAAGLASGVPPSAAIGELMALTRAMIDTTRDAEGHLRQTSVEIEGLRDDLTAAERKANSDALTGLPNRRALEARMRSAVEAARRAKQPLSVAICDIDHFKSFNDEHGHQIGDEVLKFVASAFTKGNNKRQFVARYGGEEFVILLEGLDVEAAAAEVDRVRAEVASRELKVTATGRSLGRLSFSGGVSGLEKRDSPASMLKRADSALYLAKEAGRNRIRIFQAGD